MLMICPSFDAVALESVATPKKSISLLLEASIQHVHLVHERKKQSVSLSCQSRDGKGIEKAQMQVREKVCQHESSDRNLQK